MPYSAEAMFALVDDIESYPKFLPWCARAESSREGEEVRATLHIQYFGLKTTLTTCNRHRRAERIDMRLAAGPLQSLSGSWKFSAVDGTRSRVEFFLQYQFGRGALKAVFERLFESVFERFADSFLREAKNRYERAGEICVTLAAADGEKPVYLPKGATLGDALAAGGYPESSSAGVFGRVCGSDTPLTPGDRVEVYAPLAQDPRRRRRAAADSPPS